MMNPTATMLRWYRQSTGRAAPQQQYTAQEVLQLLRPHRPHDVCTVDIPRRQDRPDDDQAARTDAVRQVAARPSTWLGNLTKRQRQEIGQLADRLPSLVFHHTIGGEMEDLVRRFGGWSTWRYDRALEVAGSCIAAHLNDPR
jgi:hypothetical protein